MKLELGKSYKYGFFILLVTWALFSFLPFPNTPDNPAFLGFSLTILIMVIYQAYSGVAIDRSWVASISWRQNKKEFFAILIGQTLIAIFAAVQAY
ncbi:hypothetical protein [Paraglaciecola sp. 25GB23A]|uniref:hypothetical protein n=1 Tax=Paraglaciecola sp. 25GB23A TaxID=3156068 RepID=UPI0032AEB413